MWDSSPDIKFIALLLSAILCGLGYGLETSFLQALCAFPFLFLITLNINHEKAYFRMFFAGILFYSTIFFWLPNTISSYFDIPFAISIIYFAIFSAITSLQFPLATLIFKRLKHLTFLPVSTCLPLAWLSGEVCFPKLTGGSISSLLNYFTISHTAQIWGELGITFILFLVTSLIANAHYKKAIVIFCTASILGIYQKRLTIEDIDAAPKINALLVQGNFPPTTKNINPLERIMELQNLSIEAVKTEKIDLVIWPESSVLIDNPVGLTNIFPGDSNDPFPGLHIPILYGTQSFLEGSRYYNSALFKLPSGEIGGEYFKRSLFPFTEYNPLRNDLWKEEYDLLPGPTTQSPISAGNYDIGMMICYDDLWTFESIHYGKNERAKILVSLLNDAWFNSDIAQRQHSLLASFRAKEQRTSLLRATNSGATIAFDPLGRSLGHLSGFEKNVLLVKDIPLLTSKTIYSQFGAPIIQFLAYLTLIIATFKLLNLNKRLFSRAK